MSLEEDPASVVSVNTSAPGSPQHTTVPPESDVSSDEFGDGDCGEPLMAQHLVLDFTPSEEDNDYVQKKCCAFWEFVNQQPELEDLVADLDEAVFSHEAVSESGCRDNFSIREQPKPISKLKSIEKTAVSMLELVEEKGLISRAFESRLPTSHCSLGLTDYEDDKADDTAKGATPPQLSISPSQKSKCQMIKKQRESRPSATSSPTVRAMCHGLQEWDKEHPKCRPICKSRRREWRGELQNTSAELILERKPIHECFRRWPTKVSPNSPCPLFARTRHVTVVERDCDRARPPDVVRICQAPIDDVVDTPYLKLAQMIQNLGATDAVESRGRGARGYEPADEARDAAARRRDMRDFDARVRRDYRTMRIMY